MPRLHFAILIGAVIAAAALTIAVFQGVFTPGETLGIGALITGLMILRVALSRR